jgi:hypothetical protein
VETPQMQLPEQLQTVIQHTMLLGMVKTLQEQLLAMALTMCVLNFPKVITLENTQHTHLQKELQPTVKLLLSNPLSLMLL